MARVDIGSMSGRLRMIAMLAFVFVLVTVTLELAASCLWWLNNGQAAVQQYLLTYGELMPGLVAPGYELPAFVQRLLMAADICGAVVLALPQIFIGLLCAQLFLDFANRERTSRLTRWAGIAYLASWPLAYLLEALDLFLVGLGVPAEERKQQLSMGMSSEAAHFIIAGLVLCIFSIVMREKTPGAIEASHLSDDARQSL